MISWSCYHMITRDCLLPTSALVSFWGAWTADAVSALPFTTEFQVKPGRTRLYLDGWPPGYSLVLILKKKTTWNVSKVVVVGLSCASRIFFRVLQFFSLHKINLSLIHLSYQTGPPLITVFLHWRGLPCINVIIIFRGEKAFICNLQQHWFTIRKLGKQVQYY